MRPAENINELIKKLQLKASTDLDKRVHQDISKALAESDKTKSALLEPNTWRTIMKNPITKLAAAAVIVVAAIICISQFGGSGTSVAWGEVADKIQASRGLIYRERTIGSDTPDEADYIMCYVSSAHSRTDTYKAGKITRTFYYDYEARNMFFVDHNDKIFGNIPMEQRGIQDFQQVMDLKEWVREVLSREHKKLGRRTIGGVLCEGLETKYPIFGDMDAPAGNSARRVWVSVETEYPLLCEGGILGDDGKLRVEAVMDQFQWDIEMGPSEFEPKKPPADYEDMEN